MATSRTAGTFVLALLATAALPAAASPAAATADSAAVATIAITRQVGQSVPTVTMPGAASTPGSWTCTTSHASKYVKVSCSPGSPAPSGTWTCDNVEVKGSISGSPLDTIEGTGWCGTVQAKCSAGTLMSPISTCESDAVGPGPMPFVCDADYAGVIVSAWSVTCRIY